MFGLTRLSYILNKSANVISKYHGIDRPTSTNFDANYPIQDFDYQFNSWGFRGPEFTEFIGKPVNICLGDSIAVNIGGPIEHSWPSQLSKNFDIPVLNLGVCGIGNDAIRLLYDHACRLFDVQNIFVMYSFLHRRLVNGITKLVVVSDEDNFLHFDVNRIESAYECALPGHRWSGTETEFLRKLGIYFLDEPTLVNLASNQQIDRKLYTSKLQYTQLQGTDWPTYEEFVAGADLHHEMLTEEFGYFLEKTISGVNRDGVHLDYESNNKYAEDLYKQYSSKRIIK